jgi:hypothetical protein
MENFPHLFQTPYYFDFKNFDPGQTSLYLLCFCLLPAFVCKNIPENCVHKFIVEVLVLSKI